MQSNKIGLLFALVAIASGLIAIFRIVPDTEVAVGFVTISFGVLAIIWTATAVRSLSAGSSLRKHVTNFLLCLTFILFFTIWHTISKIFRWRETVNEFLLYPGYVFLILAFFIFVFTSYQILTMGKEFGFENQGKIIEKLIEEKKKKHAKAKK